MYREDRRRYFLLISSQSLYRVWILMREPMARNTSSSFLFLSFMETGNKPVLNGFRIWVGLCRVYDLLCEENLREKSEYFVNLKQLP